MGRNEGGQPPVVVPKQPVSNLLGTPTHHKEANLIARGIQNIEI